MKNMTMKFSLLINKKMPSDVYIFIFTRRKMFMLNYVKQLIRNKQLLII